MKKFRKIYVEITNICNMNCSFCPDTKRAKAFMTPNDFERIAKEIAGYTDYIYLHVKGEPLIHPHLQDILNICNKYNLKVNISTNGVKLKEKYNMLTKVRQLNVSLHSIEGADIDTQKLYIEDVIESSNILSKEGVIIRYKLWNNNDLERTNQYIISLLQDKYNVDIKNTSYDKDIKLKDNIFISIRSPFKWPDLKDKEQVPTTCYGLRNQIAILVDGTVVPCCVDNDGDIKLGNIFSNSLDNILNSKEAREISQGFKDNKAIHPLCKKCQYRIYVTQM